MEKFPEFYTLHEIMTIMGGKFNTQLTFKLEKKLLVMVIFYVHLLFWCYRNIELHTDRIMQRFNFYKYYSVLGLEGYNS